MYDKEKAQQIIWNKYPELKPKEKKPSLIRAFISKEISAENRKRWIREYHSIPEVREKELVRQCLNYHIRRGHIKRLPCEVCGKLKTQGHHKDYTKPLDVVWLCKKHHHLHHRKLCTVARFA